MANGFSAFLFHIDPCLGRHWVQRNPRAPSFNGLETEAKVPGHEDSVSVPIEVALNSSKEPHWAQALLQTDVLLGLFAPAADLCFVLVQAL